MLLTEIVNNKHDTVVNVRRSPSLRKQCSCLLCNMCEGGQGMCALPPCMVVGRTVADRSTSAGTVIQHVIQHISVVASFGSEPN